MVEHMVTKENAAAPMMSSVTQATATLGAAAVAAEVTPNPRAAKRRYRRLGWWTRPTPRAVSYTHLDVYKRQAHHFALHI